MDFERRRHRRHDPCQGDQGVRAGPGSRSVLPFRGEPQFQQPSSRRRLSRSYIPVRQRRSRRRPPTAAPPPAAMNLLTNSCALALSCATSTSSWSMPAGLWTRIGSAGAASRQRWRRSRTYLRVITTGPDTASVTPSPPPRSSRVSRKELSVAIIFGRARASASASTPLGDNAIGVIARLDDVSALKARPIVMHALMCVEKIPVSAGLNPEPDGVKGGHRAPCSWIWKSSAGACAHERSCSATWLRRPLTMARELSGSGSYRGPDPLGRPLASTKRSAGAFRIRGLDRLSRTA